jgi:hypothetical protein
MRTGTTNHFIELARVRMLSGIEGDFGGCFFFFFFFFPPPAPKKIKKTDQPAGVIPACDQVTGSLTR